MGWFGVFGAGVVVICWFVLGFCFGVRSRGWWLFMDVCKLLVLVDYHLCGFCFWVCCVAIDCILLFGACVAGSLCFNCVFCWRLCCGFAGGVGLSCGFVCGEMMWWFSCCGWVLEFGFVGLLGPLVVVLMTVGFAFCATWCLR